MKINIYGILEKKWSTFHLVPAPFRRTLVWLLSRIVSLDEINSFLELNIEKNGVDFLNAVIIYLRIKLEFDYNELEKIPQQGCLMAVANHPLGGVDGILFLSLISKRRPDLLIVANHLLSAIPNISELIIPFDIYSRRTQKESMLKIASALQSGRMVLLFPAGEVSRLHGLQIVDRKWQRGVAYFSSKLNVPVMPVGIIARNSLFFYLTALISQTLSMLLLPSELVRRKGKHVKFRFGELVSPEEITAAKDPIGLLRQRVDQLTGR